MNEKDNEQSRKPRLFVRFARRLGLLAIETKQRDTTHRPKVGVFDPGHTTLMDFARKNASIAGMDDGILDRVRQLQDKYGANPGRERITYSKPEPAEHGFSREHPGVVFQWNLSDISREVSEDFLYVVGAVPSSEPTYTDAKGIQRVTQEYSSTVGLCFIDTRDVVMNDTPMTNYHELSVYLPVDHTPTVGA